MRATDAMARDLNRWIPRLLAAWRNHGGKQYKTGRSPLPPDTLTPTEMEAVAAGIKRLSEGLTRERELAGEHYFTNPPLLGAYLLYFWPVSYLQARYALKDLQRVPETVLDLGSGGGPLGAACMDLGCRQVTFADRSQTAVGLAGELAKLAGHSARTISWNPLRPATSSLPEVRYDLIGMVHVLNELWSKQSDRIARRLTLLKSLFASLKPGGSLLLIEPALTPTSRELLQVRNKLLEQGFHLAGPCLAGQPCPALEKPGDSCHAEYEWTLPPLVRELVQRVHFQKKTLKMTHLLFGYSMSTEELAKPEIFRIVSDPLVSKNKRIRLLGCGRNGRLSLALKPTAVTPSNQAFLGLKRGDLIRVAGAAPREGGLDILEKTRVEVVMKAQP